MARPSIYTAEIADTILSKLADGQTLREVCRGDAMPDERTVRTWALEDREGFAAQYSQAREIGYQRLISLKLPDDEH